MHQSPVSVVVVSYNTREKLRQCLAAIEPEHEVIVVDNASVDGSGEMIRQDFPSAHLIENSENLGFGAANNLGMARATRELILFLNSDAYVAPGAIGTLADAFKDDTVVGAGAKLRFPDGRLQDSAANELTLWAVFCEQSYLEKLFPQGSFLSPYWVTERLAQCAENQPTAQVMGACLMVRPLEKFDERYFLYCEDTDLCLRLSRHGQIVYVPRAEVVHELGSSSSETRWTSIARYNRGKELYFALHRGRVAHLICWILNRKGAAWRMLVWGLIGLATLGMKRNAFRQAALFFKVLWAPAAGPKSSAPSNPL